MASPAASPCDVRQTHIGAWSKLTPWCAVRKNSRESELMQVPPVSTAKAGPGGRSPRRHPTMRLENEPLRNRALVKL